MNTIQEAVFVLDGAGTIVQTNPLGARMIVWAGGGTTLAERMELVEFRDEQGRTIPPDRTGGRRSLNGEFVREINHLVFKRTGERRSFFISSSPMQIGDHIHSVVVVLADITEEVVRFRGHLEHWQSLSDSPEPCGRKLDFLLQEMNREVNTAGSKAEGPTVSELVVALKADLEKMREQAQNVE